MRKKSKILLVIPARYASSRLPGKPLYNLEGKKNIKKTLIERTWLLAQSLKIECKIIIATDDIRIKNFVRGFGAEVIMTSKKCKNGTERVAEVVKKIDESFDIILNLQGDALLTPHWFIEETIKEFMASDCEVVTPIMKCDKMIFKNLKKNFKNGVTGGTTVVTNYLNKAMYFSKSLIPYLNNYEIDDIKNLNVFFHVGFYCYSQNIILKYPDLKVSFFEKAEGLEQLRFLYNDISISCVKVDSKNFDIWELNNKSDIPIIEKILKNRGI